MRRGGSTKSLELQIQFGFKKKPSRYPFFSLIEKYSLLYWVTDFAPATPRPNFTPGLSSIKDLVYAKGSRV